MIGRQLGPYRILSKIGEGGMATVWTARHDVLGRDVALKILKHSLAADPHARTRFLGEARWASGLDHPNIASVLDAGAEGDDLYIAFTLVQGDTVGTLAERWPLPVEDVVRMGISIGEALARVHAHGLVHRDITARNIMKSVDGRFMLLDFGLALGDHSTRLTSGDVVMGTRAYLSPEVLRLERARPPADLWGLGVVMFEALTGRLPFTGGDPSAVLYSITHMAPPGLRNLRPEVPEGLEAVVMKALEKDLARRYGSADAMVADLRALGIGSGAGPPTHDAPGEEHAPLPLHNYGRRFLAVLPFSDLEALADPGGQRERFASGLAEILAAALAREPGLDVIPPTAVPPDYTSQSDRDLASQLRANLLLRGELRREGTRLKLTYSLIDPARGLTLDSARVEGTVAHLSHFEEDLAHSVCAALGLRATTAPKPGRTDAVVEERYRKALGYLQREENEAMVDGATSLLESLASADHASAEIHAALGRAYLYKYRLTFEPRWEKRAVQACARAMTLDPKSAEVLVTLGNVHLTAGRWTEAVDDFDRALTLGDGDVQGHIGRGMALEALGRPAEAEEAFRAAIAADPDDAVAWGRLGAFLTRRGHYAEAVEIWQKVIEFTPDNARAYSNLAGTYFHMDELERALPLFRRSLKIQPTATAYSNLATTLYMLAGEAPGTERANELLRESAELLERATALRPADARMWGYLGSVCRFIEGRERTFHDALERAVVLMRERLDRNPDDPYDWSQLAGWLYNLGCLSESEDAIRRALALAPDDLEILAKAGTVCHQLGLREESLHYWKRALAGGHSPAKVLRDPYVADLRDDAAFMKIMEETAAARKR